MFLLCMCSCVHLCQRVPAGTNKKNNAILGGRPYIPAAIQHPVSMATVTSVMGTPS